MSLFYLAKDLIRPPEDAVRKVSDSIHQAAVGTPFQAATEWHPLAGLWMVLALVALMILVFWGFAYRPRRAGRL